MRKTNGVAVAVAFGAAAWFAGTADADTVSYSFRAPPNGPAGVVEGGNNLRFGNILVQGWEGTSTDVSVVQTADGLGVAGAGSGTIAAQIDDAAADEFLTLDFGRTVELLSVDVRLIDNSGPGDTVRVSNGSDFQTATFDFNGFATFVLDQSLTGQVFTFSPGTQDSTSGSNFALAGVSIAPIPPAVFGGLGLLGLAGGKRLLNRRRHRSL